MDQVVIGDEREGPPQTIGQKCLDTTHFKSPHGRLQAALVITSFVTFLAALISNGVSHSNYSSQIVGVAGVYGLSFVLNLIHLSFYHFKVDSSFEIFETKRSLLENLKVTIPLTLGLLQIFSLLTVNTYGYISINLTMFLGYITSLLHILQIKWIMEIKDYGKEPEDFSQPTYRKSRDLFPEFSSDDDADDDIYGIYSIS